MVSREMISDEALMLEYQGGSREAFEELFARYRGALYGFFRRRLESDLRAEDLMQETFLAVIKATARYEPRALVRTYLYGIAMNLLSAERRKRFRGAPPGEVAPEPAINDAPESVMWIRQALARLDEGDREILMLREYEQLSYAEIAELTKVPLNTVRSRLFRARMALKEQLDPKLMRKETAMPSAIEEGTRLTRAEGEAI
jgi:RNA polymerase sigma-70 factor, ECF subfamily